uniref:LacI family transcriptional regulator n=1 Tax=Eiseniibacteriota bacterium TaxID=2212470 RepID=A0A832I6A9_UNCEI
MATIRDVARASNVSIATVSRVFNNSPLVSEETRQRVVAAAASLGYWPNGIARSLITNRTHTLGALLPDLHGEFFSEVIHGIDLASRKKGFHLLVSRSSSDARELASVLRSMRGRVDGLLVMTPDLDAAATLEQVAGNLPTVLLNPEARIPGCDSVSVANVEGATAVVRHLIGLGHRRIATITGPERNIDARQRREGWRAALREAGIDPDAALEVRGDFTEPSGYEAALELLAREPRPTAVFVANDYMAIGALGALQDTGVRVPEDLAIAGFDDIPMARYLTPPLTTVHVDMLELGQQAVHLLLDPDRAARAGAAEHRVLPSTLVVRSSCGGAPGDHGTGRARWGRRTPAARLERPGP